MKQKRLSLFARRKAIPNHPFHRRHNLAPALRPMEDNWAAKLNGKRELGLENLPHARGDVAAFQTIKPNLANASVWVVEKLSAKRSEKWNIRD
jgi:hypothetical protein